MVSLARAIAAQQLLPSATCLSHTSAALIHGLAMWTGEPDVYLAVSGNPRLTTTTLPAFRYPSSGVPAPIDPAHPEATPIRMHRRRLQLRDEEIEAVGGVPVTSVLRTAFDCACDEPPFNALSIADAALNRHCRPDPWHRGSCATRLRSAHACWEELVARHRGRRGIAQARAVLAAATPWAVSPGESVLRWMTLVVGLPRAIAQFPVPGLSKDRFLDLGWPRSPCRRGVRRPDQVPHRGGHLPREAPPGRARVAGVEVLPGDVVLAQRHAHPGGPVAVDVPPGGGLPPLAGSRASRWRTVGRASTRSAGAMRSRFPTPHPDSSNAPTGIGNVLSDRRLRSPPDHWGRTSVTWRTSQSSAHMYVPDPPPPRARRRRSARRPGSTSTPRNTTGSRPPHGGRDPMKLGFPDPRRPSGRLRQR